MERPDKYRLLPAKLRAFIYSDSTVGRRVEEAADYIEELEAKVAELEEHVAEHTHLRTCRDLWKEQAESLHERVYHAPTPQDRVSR